MQVSHQCLAVYDSDRNEPAFPADVLMPVTYEVAGRHQPC